MGIKTALAGVTLTGGDVSTAEAGEGMDIKGLMSEAQLRCDELHNLLTQIQTQMTAAGDTSNATTIGTQITALS